MYKIKRKVHRGIILALAVLAGLKQKNELDVEYASLQLSKLMEAGVDMDDFYLVGCGPLFGDVMIFFANLYWSLGGDDWQKVKQDSAAHRFCIERVKEGLSDQGTAGELDRMMKVLEVKII